MSTGGKSSDLKTALLERLHNPTQLRILVTAVMLLVGYLAICRPLSDGITETTRKLTKDQNRLELADEVAHLRNEYANFKDRIPEKTDSNEWVQYMLGGIRQLPLKLIALNATATKEVGPYKAVVMSIELEGVYQDLDTLLRWLETNERLFRVDELKIVPHRSGNGNLVMQVTVLGVMG